MKRKYNEFYIGLAVIITILAVIATILFLEKNNFLQKGFTLNLVVQNAQGIKPGGDVLYRGLEIGSVEETKLISNGVLLKLKITKTDSIPEDSKFKVTTTNLIGSPSIEIIPGKSKSILKDGEYLKGESGKSYSDIIQAVNKITDNINRMIKNVDTLTSKETIGQLQDAINKIDESVGLIHRSLRTNLSDIHSTIENMKEITSVNKAPIDSIIYRLSLHSKQIAVTMDNIEKITKNLNDIVTSLNEGKGTAGKLLTNDEISIKINDTITNLNNLIEDIKNNPAKYVHISIF